MWDEARDKIARLREVDRQLQAFGAHHHRYELRPRLDDAAVAETESRLGVALPEALTRFYREVGDGGAGPHYGLEPAEKLEGLRPRDPYPGIEALKQAAAADGIAPDERGYFETPREAIAGLLPVIHEGCGHLTCLIVTGDDIGRVIYVNADGFVIESTKTLVDVYHEWLDGELEKFAAVRELMEAGHTREQIYRAMVDRYDDHCADDRIVSIIDVAKPEELFGEGGRGRYHGAVQFPWYEKVLLAWQRARGIR